MAKKKAAAAIDARRALIEGRLRKAATWFLLVSPNERRGRRLVRLNAPSVLAWFQRLWEGASWSAELEGNVYGFDSLLDAIREQDLPVPKTDAELAAILEEHLYFEQDLETDAHFVHVKTDDDEVDIEYFFFDEAFLRNGGADRLPSPASIARPEPDEDEDEDDEEEDRYAALLGERNSG